MTLVDPPDGCCFCADGNDLDENGVIDGNGGMDGGSSGTNEISPTCTRNEFKCFDQSECLPRYSLCMWSPHFDIFSRILILGTL